MTGPCLFKLIAGKAQEMMLVGHHVILWDLATVTHSFCFASARTLLLEVILMIAHLEVLKPESLIVEMLFALETLTLISQPMFPIQLYSVMKAPTL